MKAKALWVLKAFGAGCLAFAVLNLLTCIYRGGLPSITDETMSTPVRYVPNTYFSIMTEGISIGVYDKNGYNNAYPSKESIDYLVLGSSHMEAKEVMPNQNTVYYLNELLNAGEGNEYAYNLGISGESLPMCISRMKYAISTYHPQKAIIMETATLNFSQAEVDDALQEVRVGGLLYSYSGVMGTIRKLPYVRLAYINIKAILGKASAEANDIIQSDNSSEVNLASYTARVTTLIDKTVENANGLPVIIFYHPSVLIRQDGSISTTGNAAMIQSFCDICEAKGVIFLDLSERFLHEYEENYTLPYGFCNTSVGSGHLNKYGHAMIADELYKLFGR